MNCAILNTAPIVIINQGIILEENREVFVLSSISIIPIILNIVYKSTVFQDTSLDFVQKACRISP